MTSKLILLALSAAALAGCGALVGSRADQREIRAESLYPPIGQIVTVEGQQVHVWVEGSGPDLVLLHGASGNLRDFTFDLAGRLTDRYRVVAFDRPGMGWTDRPDGYGGTGNTKGESPMLQAQILQKAADQLGVRNPVVVGHSYGGAVALAWGLERPEDTAALVLLGAVSMPWPGDLGALYSINSSAIGGATVVPLITAFAPDSRIDDVLGSIFAPQSAPEGYSDRVGVGLSLRRTSLRSNAQQVNTLRPHIVEMRAQYTDTLNMPIELVHGAADTTVPPQIHAQEFIKLVSQANLTMLPGVGHMPHHADPQATVAAIDRAAGAATLR